MGRDFSDQALHSELRECPENENMLEDRRVVEDVSIVAPPNTRKVVGRNLSDQAVQSEDRLRVADEWSSTLPTDIGNIRPEHDWNASYCYDVDEHGMQVQESS